MADVRIRMILFAGVVLWFSGCDKNPLGTIDPRGNAPSVLNFAVSPASVRLDTISVSGGHYAVPTTFSAHLGASDASISVIAHMYDASGTEFVQSPLTLTSPSTNTYSAVVPLSFLKTDVGQYSIVLEVTGANGFHGTSAIRSFVVSNRTSKPWLSNLVMPDTVTIPAGGGTSFSVSVAANDSNGIATIASVLLQIPEGNNPNGYIQLLDNGLAANGDVDPGDGIYSIKLSVTDSPTVRKTYTFHFIATNKGGDTSAVLIHPLVMR
jgi:hypothetical protein